MAVNRGDIVLADLPFSDASGSKVRPGLVVQCDTNHRRLDDAIVALVTRNTQRAALEPTQLLIDITTAEGRQSGLLHTSAVKCEHLIALHQKLIRRTIGTLPPVLMQRIDGCLRVALDLP
jgi:mRNA-degrading endonuclease toxin of MazEF toxin-antitoxin module